VKIRQIMLLISAAFLTQSALANITLLMDSSKDMCNGLTGTWVGSGTAKASLVTCQYSGIVQVMPGNLPGTYVALTNLRLDSGTFCPSEVELQMTGSCKDQELTLENKDTNLSGKIGSNGLTADLSGYVYFHVLVNQVRATLENVHLQKLEIDGPQSSSDLNNR
jgi:hypothetical protein